MPNIEVGLTTKTCSCGGVYAVPHWLTYGYECPMCASRRMETLRREIAELEEDAQRQRRVIAALKGVAKRKGTPCC